MPDVGEPLFDLAVCSEMVFLDLPIVERIKRNDDLGFRVEIWSRWDKDLDALSATGATFSSMTGYVSGNLTDPEAIDQVRRCAPYIGEVQVADVPGRCEPGTGEINYPAVAAALYETGYRGVVGLEGWAAGDDGVALERFRTAFSR